jgi:hypothetical protein
MRIRTRIVAATAVATAALAGPAILATTASQASAATAPLCVHVFVASASQGGLIDLHVNVISSPLIAPGPCPTK